jgi:serine phosphatase RsbU (regulator of sigma subunit)/anti-sigma regulatory factor (Ser/Thr protein kinase)
MQQLVVAATWDGVHQLMDFVNEVEHTLSLTSDQSYVARLAVEEIATNIVKYSYPNAVGVIEVTCAITEGALRLTIRDQGPSFDPRRVPDPELDNDLATRDVGGLGIFLVRDLADELYYTHNPDNGWNELTIVKRRNAPGINPELLRPISWFTSLPDPQLAALAADITEQQLENGEFLFHEGEVGHDCYAILSGALEVLTHMGGTALTLEVRQPGHIVGEMALIDRGPRSASLRAIGATRLAVISERNFLTLMHSNPEMSLDLLRVATARQRKTSQQMMSGLEAKNAELRQAYVELQAAQSELIRLSRIEEELAVARRIQESFLPKHIPQPTGWQFAAFNRGALEVGGDFFDFVELPNHQIGIVVADVSGKGVPAALFVALTRSLVRAALQAQATFEPQNNRLSQHILANAIQLTNNYLTREHGDDNMFVTLFYALLQPETGQLSYINAGHNPPLIFLPDSSLRCELTEHATLPLGIIDNQHYTIAEQVIAVGETFVAFSDGITEAMNSNEELFDDARLIATIQQHFTLEANAMVQATVDAVDTFVAGAPQSDDITLMIIRRML